MRRRLIVWSAMESQRRKDEDAEFVLVTFTELFDTVFDVELVLEVEVLLVLLLVELLVFVLELFVALYKLFESVFESVLVSSSGIELSAVKSDDVSVLSTKFKSTA